MLIVFISGTLKSTDQSGNTSAWKFPRGKPSCPTVRGQSSVPFIKKSSNVISVPICSILKSRLLLWIAIVLYSVGMKHKFTIKV